MNRKALLAYLLALALSAAAAALAPQNRGDFDIHWWTVDGGGVMLSSGSDFELSGTIGQPDTGVMSGGDFTLTGGFWAGSPTAGEPCPADVNGDAVVDVLDLLAVIAAWGTPGSVPEDINGDGIVDVLDLLAVIAAWGPCPPE